MSEVLCRRIDDDLENLNIEHREVRSELDALNFDAQNLEARLSEAEDRLRSFVPSPPMRNILRRSPIIGFIADAVSVLEGITSVNAQANAQSDVQQLGAELQSVRRNIQDLEYRLQNKERAIRDQQQGYSQYNCYDLGFSHEVMNFPN